MATSGSYDWTIDRTAIIKAAFQRSGIVSVGGSASSDQLTEGSLLLNGIIKSMSASLGFPLWTIQYGVVFPIHGTTPHSIQVGPSGGHVSQQVYHTTLTADSAATDTTLTVDSITGFSASDYIGIELDNGNIDWTTVNGAPSGSTITITAGVTTLASTGNHVWGYTTKLDRPARILEAYNRDYTDSDNLIDTPIWVVTPAEFNSLSTKATEGSMRNYLTYEPHLTNGSLKYWPGFIDGSKVIHFRYHRMIQDMDDATNTLDFPQEYFLPVVFELAVQLASQYGIEMNKLKWLERQADKYLKMVSQNDYEEGSIYLAPDVSRWG